MSTYTIGIIGGTGQMGRWFERFFIELGHKVLIAGRRTPLAVSDCAKKSHIVMLSVPLGATVDICREIGPLLTEDQLLMDICSLKETIVKEMKHSTRAEVVGAHPLFGPFTSSIQGQNVILCPGKGSRWFEWLQKEFREKGAVVTSMDATLHDKHMAVVQGLTHFISICMGKTFQKMGISPENILPSSTPIFRLQLSLVGRLFAQDLALYKNLIGNNRYTADVLETFQSTITQTKDKFLFGTDDNTMDFLEEIRHFIGGFCKDGLEESNDFLNSISEAP